MKKKALIAAILAATTFSTATAFAAENPFNDVPADHWSYDALAMLAKDGVIEGYGDGTFQGDKLMNRYEMAEIVAKAAEQYGTAALKDKGVINKLEREYAQELKDMDVRLTQVESDVKELKKNQSSFKMYGDARLRWFQNKDMKLHDKSATTKASQAENRVRLGIYAEPAKNLSVDGRLKYEDSYWNKDGWGGDRRLDWDGDYNNHNAFRLDKLSLNWNHANTKVSVGRTEISLGQGLLYWENPVDGFYVAHQFAPKVNVMAGWGDMSAATWSDSSVGAAFANVKVQTSPATQLTAAYFHTNTEQETAPSGINYWMGKNEKYEVWSGSTKVGDVWIPSLGGVSKNSNWGQYKYQMNQLALGLNTQLTPKWNLIAEGVRNNTSLIKHKNGLWTRLTYGKQVWNQANTWHVYGEYFALGGGSIDSKGWQHRLNIAGGNAKDVGFTNDAGARGWGLGVGYMLAANTNLELTYYKLKPYDKNLAGFSNYDDVAYAALSYSF